MMFPSRLFICLTLMLLSYSHNLVTAQCALTNLVTTHVLSTQMSISWRCFDRDADDEFQVTYQLINRGQCDTGDGSQDPPFDSQTTQWGTWNRQPYSGNTYQHSAALTNLLPYSTYQVYVQARQPGGGGGYNYGFGVFIDPEPTTIEAAPGSVTNLQQGTVTATSIQVTWMEPTFKGECPIVDSLVYEVTGIGVSQQSGCPSLSAHNLAGQTSISLSYTRTPARPYYTYIISVNPVGGPIREIGVHTRQSAPDVAPANIELTSSSSSSLTISWDEIPCINRNGIITGYPYQLLQGAIAITDDDATAPSTSVIIPDLTPNTEYVFKVAAQTINGAGPMSSGYSFQTETVSVNPPTSISVDNILSTSIRLSWNDASCPDPCPGGITSYTWRLLQSGVDIRNDTTDANERSVIISGLMPCTEYEFRVAAGSADVIGSYSEGEISTTAGEVDALIITPQSANELDVSWTVPPESCTTNTEYTVEYRLINKDQCMELGNGQTEYGTVSGTSSTLTGLLPFSTYEVSVRVGMSIATELADTHGSRPTGFPRNIRAMSTTNSSITYSWTEPMCGERNGIIDKYTYTFLKTGSSPDLQHNNVFTSDPTVAFSDLEPYTEYSFIISANTEDGVGPQATFKHRTLDGVVPPRSSTGLIAGVAIAVILVIIIVIAIVVVYRRRKASMKETPKETPQIENEIYDEIDAKKEMMAKQQQPQQRLQTVDTGYEVNIAMETNMSPRAQSDGSAYEDVNIKEESGYQGLDLDTVNEEQSYQDLKGNTAADKSAPQYANV